MTCCKEFNLYVKCRDNCIDKHRHCYELIFGPFYSPEHEQISAFVYRLVYTLNQQSRLSITLYCLYKFKQRFTSNKYALVLVYPKYAKRDIIITASNLKYYVALRSTWDLPNLCGQIIANKKKASVIILKLVELSGVCMHTAK